MKKLTYFISSHGYGHATRACAVINALLQRYPALHVDIYTQAPSWIFTESLPEQFTIHYQQVDVGLIQLTPLDEDLNATIRSLVDFYPLDQDLITSLAAEIHQSGSRAIICDISPLGIAVASQAGLPSILIENFTWDWIYQGYLNEEPGFAPFIEQIRQIYAQVNCHLQTEPVCLHSTSAVMHAPPASRKPRHSIEYIRQNLGLTAHQPVILISMGGIKGRVAELHTLAQERDITFLVPGGSSTFERWDSLILLPHHGQYYHPDLVHACDAIVSKAGYSTVAEAYAAGIPFGYISRARFREASVMANFISQKMQGFEIPEWAFNDGSWVQRAPDLLQFHRQNLPPLNGAELLAAAIVDFLK